MAPVGSAVPPFTAHAISVSLPTWRDTVGYEEGEKRVVDAMETGYPRFFIHLSIQKLARICEQKFGVNGERCMLFSTQKIAEQCRSFMTDRPSPVAVRLVQFVICPEDNPQNGVNGTISTEEQGCGCSNSPTPIKLSCVDLHIVLFPAEAFPIAKQFWQHAGMGISSRLAERCLALLPEDSRSTSPTPPTPPLFSKPANRHYSKKSVHTKSPSLSSPPRSPVPSSPSFSSKLDESLSTDQSTYLEERYGRNLPLTAAASAKRALRRRIAGTLVHDDDPQKQKSAGATDAELGPSSRGVKDVTEDDVYLYPTGMSAIWASHQLAMAVRPSAKSVCFGFPYTDTLKILEKWGPGCHFLGHGLDSDIDTLSDLLATTSQAHPGSPPILALFTEFPSNPLLRSANMPRLRALADKYNFLIVVDETIGNFINVEVLPFADVVVSSLTKVFSGDSNVMGGSLILNPKSSHYPALKSHLSSNYDDFYFEEDAIYMERNSRDFKRRIAVIDENAQAVCAFLRSRSIAGGATSPSTAIKEVYYPKYSTPENYEQCRVRASAEGGQEGGYGGLFSLTFLSHAASTAFFDALPFHKGPSLGTSFTLACPYTVLAHYGELEWAKSWGVEEGLVRISVGCENRDVLVRGFESSLEKAEEAIVSGSG
ncbi:hypothetical protein JAAARDRAFT_129085 [Jaapia argillacea MUCL 33604]|uniref:cystathionine gamma-synthase n=1 Tax=Jaapia argillacea MUCL 33604 TaxID=933084 RepID=A0A067PUA2_9AGAM|nr:hypothetical protein JAAARDRAFT_129085 [Jaapia argillacea MUCL 33604]